MAALATAAPAGAATTAPLSGGTTSLTIDASARRALARAGIAIAPARPASGGGARVTLPIAGGAIDPATAKGRIAHRGGLALRMGTRRVALASPTINTTRRSLAVKVGRRTVVLATARGGRVARDGFATRLAGVRLALTKQGAALLNRTFRVKALRPGLALGTATLAPRTDKIVLASGEATLTFSADARSAFGALNVSVTPVAPATADVAAGVVRFPLASGTLNRDSSRLVGTIAHRGGVALQPQGTEGVALTDLRLAFGESATLSVNLGTIATLDLADATRMVDARARTVWLNDIRVRLNAFAATALNGLFSANAFADGAEIGTISLTARAR
jgi:hypothetical protein